MKDATSELIRALFGVNFANFALEEARSRNWASVTFTGTRHELRFRLSGSGAEADADAFLDGLEEREFALRGHILADVALVSRSAGDGSVRIALEALTVEDC